MGISRECGRPSGGGQFTPRPGQGHDTAGGGRNAQFRAARPRSDNTWQSNGIVLPHSNLDVLFRNDPNVFVAGNHLIPAVSAVPPLADSIQVRRVLLSLERSPDFIEYMRRGCSAFPV